MRSCAVGVEDDEVVVVIVLLVMMIFDGNVACMRQNTSMLTLPTLKLTTRFTRKTPQL